jgi:hypothetical protein
MAERRVDRSDLVDFALGKLSPEESLRVLDAIEGDPALSAQLEEIAVVVRGIDRDGEELFGKGREDRGRSSGAVVRDSGWLYVIRAAAVFVVLIGLSVLVSALTAGRYDDLTALERVELDVRFRGFDAEDLVRARAAHGEGDEDGALFHLDRFLRMNPEGESSDFARVLAGSIRVEGAESSVLGLFRQFDEEKIMFGLRDLLLVIAHSENPRLVEEASWIVAKGYLMLGRPGDAAGHLRRVVGGGGSRVRGAQELLEEINRRGGR